MAWVTPRTWVSGELVTAALMNTHVRDNLAHVYPNGSAWTSVAFSAGNFTGAASMTWTVESGDQVAYRYVVVGNTMHLTVLLTGTTVGGTPNSDLRIAVPNGRTITGYSSGPANVLDNGTHRADAYWEAGGGTTYITIRRSLASDNWAASTNATLVMFTATFEVD